VIINTQLVYHHDLREYKLVRQLAILPHFSDYIAEKAHHLSSISSHVLLEFAEPSRVHCSDEVIYITVLRDHCPDLTAQYARLFSVI
jgi:hypothetical protein